MFQFIVETFIVSPLALELLQALLGRFLGAFAITSPELTPPYLKPSLLRPIPTLREEAISVIGTIVYFALDENKLPRTHNRSSLNFLINVTAFNTTLTG
jgi:hypothetical protein